MSNSAESTRKTDATIDSNDGEGLDALGKELGISREEVLNVIAITGSRIDDVRDYVKQQGSPGTTP